MPRSLPPSGRHRRPLSRGLVSLLALATLLLPLLWVAPAGAALDLRAGSRGATVRTAEGRLYTLGHLRRVHVDRVYRLATVRAVRAFQRQRKLPVTGRVDQRTWDVLARAVAPKPAAPLPPAPVIAGHRGTGDGGAPENTLAAMRYAAGSVDVLEMDVRATSDGRLVLMHDQTLDRTTNCSGDVAALTYAELSARCWIDTAATPEPVPTFEELAAYVATTTRSIAPEVKPGLTEAHQQELVAILNRHGLASRTFVQVNEVAAATGPRLKALEPRLRVVYLTSTAPEPAAVKAAGAAVVALNRTAATAASVGSLQEAGLAVWPWTATTVDQLRALWAMRVDGVITDLPREAQALFHP